MRHVPEGGGVAFGHVNEADRRTSSLRRRHLPRFHVIAVNGAFAPNRNVYSSLFKEAPPRMQLPECGKSK